MDGFVNDCSFGLIPVGSRAVAQLVEHTAIATRVVAADDLVGNALGLRGGVTDKLLPAMFTGLGDRQCCHRFSGTTCTWGTWLIDTNEHRNGEWLLWKEGS